MDRVLSDGHHDSRHDSFLTDTDSHLESLSFTAGHLEARRSLLERAAAQVGS